MATIAVIVLTFDEEDNLPAALDSVEGWAERVFVVDSYSTDRTVDIALERANVEVVQHAFENYSAQWNWALDNLPITQDWTLKLDADERVTQAFKTEVGELIERGERDLEGIYFRRKLYFMGEPLHWGGAQDNDDLRMWRTGCARFEERTVNEHALVKGGTARVGALVEHHDFKSVSDWIDKHNRYSSLEALSILAGNLTGDVEPRLFGAPDQRRIWLRRLYYCVPARPFLYFAYRYFLRLGFLDGFTGFRFWFLHASFLYWIDLKKLENAKRGTVPVVRWPLRGAPHPALEPGRSKTEPS